MCSAGHQDGCRTGADVHRIDLRRCERRAENARAAAQERPECNVIQHGHPRHELDVLERAADAAASDLERLAAGNRRATKQDIAGGERQRAGNQVEHRAFAGAVGTDEAEDLAGLNREAEVVHGDEPAELLARFPDFEQRSRPRRAVARRQRRRVGHRHSLRLRQPARDPRPYALARTLQDDHHQHAEHDHLEIATASQHDRQPILEHLLGEGNERRADHRAPDAAERRRPPP